MIVASVLGGLVLLGARVWLDLGDEVEAVVAAAGIVGVLVAALNVLKGKLVMAISSLLVPVVGAFGVTRLARPGLAWARLYEERKRERSRQRFPEPWLPARVLASRKGAALRPRRPDPRPRQPVDATTGEVPGDR